MKKNTEQGGFVIKLMIIVVGACVMFLVLAVLANGTLGSINLSAPIGDLTERNPNTDYYDGRINPLLDFGDGTGFIDDSTRSTPNTDGKGVSAYSNAISFSAGNTSTSQPHEEYLVLRNSGKTPIDITGWAIMNGKGSRPIQNSGNSYFYPSADVAVIGQGTEFLDPSGRSNIGNIVLKPGDTAYITTGGPFAQFPFPIATSFRENICQGYLEDYPFFPRLQQSCPSIAADPQIRTVTDECYDYITSLARCPNPQRTERKVYDQQPSHCKAFIEARVGYKACVAQNGNVSGFSLKQWRVFLGQKREMWANSRETITLYDSKGTVVDQISY
ncbi:MAG TPA: hypothetical protein VGE35_03090 [Candidatus Paceibacterota bacterium]